MTLLSSTVSLLFYKLEILLCDQRFFQIVRLSLACLIEEPMYCGNEKHCEIVIVVTAEFLSWNL